MKGELKKILDMIASQPDLSAEITDRLMSKAFALATDSAERREAGEYLKEAIGKRKRHDIDVREILSDEVDAINLSYIAKRYFNKDRTWLYQRLNHAIVNGKPAAFTEAELKRLSDSFEELSNKFHQISVQLTH
ncbi:MAG: DUF5053 domain-containing protein [Muribaculaceae bacterium]|nr:DUF5053 domain-containing protein [Muribaculaceae bacterium]